MSKVIAVHFDFCLGINLAKFPAMDGTKMVFFFPHISKYSKKNYKNPSQNEVLSSLRFSSGKDYEKDYLQCSIPSMLFLYQDFYCSGIAILSTADYFYSILFLLLETASVLYERLEQKYSLVQLLIFI